MNLLRGLFACLPLGRLFLSINAQTEDHEQHAGYSSPHSLGYCEPSAMAIGDEVPPREFRQDPTTAAPRGPQATPSRHEASGAAAPSLRVREMHVIDALFHRPGAPRVAEVEWNDFIRVMAHIGFSVVPGNHNNFRFRVANSSVIFPVESQGEVITAHRPHGGRTALSLNEMRGIGRRMTRAFGWSTNTFENQR